GLGSGARHRHTTQGVAVRQHALERIAGQFGTGRYAIAVTKSSEEYERSATELATGQWRVGRNLDKLGPCDDDREPDTGLECAGEVRARIVGAEDVRRKQVLRARA